MDREYTSDTPAKANPYTGTPDDAAEYQAHLMTRQHVPVDPNDPSVANLRE